MTEAPTISRSQESEKPSESSSGSSFLSKIFKFGKEIFSGGKGGEGGTWGTIKNAASTIWDGMKSVGSWIGGLFG